MAGSSRQSSAIKVSFLVIQVAALVLLSWACDQLALWLGIPIPGSVIGLAIILGLLAMNWLPERTIQVGAAWLIGDLLLFFIPPVVAALHFEPLLETYGIKLLVFIVVGTASVMLGTGWAVDKLFTFEQGLNQTRANKLAAKAMNAGDNH